MAFPRIKARRVDGYCQDLKWGSSWVIFLRRNQVRVGCAVEKKGRPCFFLGAK